MRLNQGDESSSGNFEAVIGGNKSLIRAWKITLKVVYDCQVKKMFGKCLGSSGEENAGRATLDEKEAFQQNLANYRLNSPRYDNIRPNGPYP